VSKISIGGSISEGAGLATGIMTTFLVSALTYSLFIDIITSGLRVALPDGSSMRFGDAVWEYVLNPENLGQLAIGAVVTVLIFRILGTTIDFESGGGSGEHTPTETTGTNPDEVSFYN
jgi:hypothetical protein